MLARAGRTAVVTGAASGIGRALAFHAAGMGMTVAIGDVDVAALAETAAAVRACGVDCIAAPLDICDPAALAAFAGQVAAAAPPIGLLFANAGILIQGSMIEAPLAALRRLVEVNLLGTVGTVEAFLPALRRAGTAAHIVVTASTAAMASYPGLGGYCATKHALWPIAESLRDELQAAGDPIGVSLLLPGAVTTAIFGQADAHRAPAPDAITPAAAAAIAFAGIAQGRFLIPTHPAFAERARARFASVLLELAAPPPPADGASPRQESSRTMSMI